MSGYLQRMAASVVSRERAIHPVLGSLWGPRRDTDFVERSEEVPVQPATPRGVQTSEPHVRQAHSERELRPAAPDAKYAEAVIPAMQPLLPQTAPSIASAAENLHVETMEDEAVRRTEALQPDQRRIFTPLIESQSWPQSESRTEPRVQEAPQPLAVSRINAQQRQTQLRQPERETDAIEIHIGRIEVLAAPPQKVQRAPAPAPRKSMDLREYLKRGGRAR